MKKLGYLLSTAVLLSVLFTVSCKKKNDPGPSEEQLRKDAMTAKTWTLNSATLSSQPVTDLTGLTLTIDSNFGYSTNSTTLTRQPNPWPVGGTFAFGTNGDGTTNINQVIRDNEVTMIVTVSADGSTMTLAFTFADGNTGSGGRTEAVNGDWFFEFN